ncbi:dynactin subunit 2-like [Sitodiplosis mosellana]|uniref:dynactin subunit 2-like n=1 Tax=Sitodiplosis mosellana TaxID=263140 RepID=UPI00244490DC|nr:dynactin subunit 2-like [Sitodiplosis mosellana]
MADFAKFANLPGIAYDQPDVYENKTPDAPECTSNLYEDTEAECIERLHFSSDNSNNKIDYSQHNVRGGCWELAGHGEKETPIEKYRRIKCEMDELLNEIVDLNICAAVSKKDKESYEAVSQAVNSAQKVLGSLKLDSVLGSETIPSACDSEIKKLLIQIEGFRKNNASQISAEKSTQQLEQTKRIAELEARLHHIEVIIGKNHSQPDKLNRLASTFDTRDTSLVDTVQQISTKAALLQPAQLDLIENRVSVLSSKLNTIKEKALVISGKNGANDESDRVAALYDIAKKVEPISKFLPDMLNRMQALETLHSHANSFNKTTSELESTQSTLVSNLNGNKALLQNVQETFALNLESVNQEIEKLETRLKASEKK